MKDAKVSLFNSIFFFIVVFGLFFLFFGRIGHNSSTKPSGFFRGFDIDAGQSIYIGTEKKIYVYKDGVLLRTILPPTSRAYCFYIENELLFIGCASDDTGGVYHLSGDQISYGNIRYSKVKSKANYKVATKDGHEYRISQNLMGSYYVTCDNELILQTESSFYDSIWYWLSLAILVLFFIIFVLILMTSKDGTGDGLKPL